MNFEQLEDFFYDLGVEVSPAEFHGFLSGRISCGHIAINRLIEESIAWLGISNKMNQEVQKRFSDLHVSFLNHIEDPGFLFKPMLPDEEIPLAERLMAVGEWCGNYVSGFGEDLQDTFKLSDAASEALEDISSIAQISIEFDGDGESDYMELIEYIRIAVQLIYAEVHSREITLH